MRPLITLPISLLLACGPVGPHSADSTTTATTTSGTTAATLPPTTSTATEITTTVAPTTDISTTLIPTTSEVDFVIEPDAGPGTTICDQFKQDCPPGQKCMPWADNGSTSWNATKCVDVTGDGAPGEPCNTMGGGVSGMDDCAFGSMCWDVDENNHGTCIALCTGTIESPMCPPKSTCYVANDEVLILCFPDCDPLLQDCPDGDLCIPSEPHFICVLDASGDGGQLNGPCELANECDKGLLCSVPANASSACDPDAPGCCQPMCKFPDAPCPNPDQQCLQLFDPMSDIPPDYKTIGVCGIPK